MMAQMMAQWLESTPFWQKGLVLSLMVGLVLIGFYGWILEPTQTQIQALERDMAGLSQEIQNQMEKAKMRTTLETEVQELEKVIQGQTGGLLLTEHRVGRRSEIMRIANEFGLALTFWKPEDLIQESPGQFVKVPVQVRVEGGYHQVAQFLESVLTRPWVLEVTTLTMARNSGIGETSTLWTSFRLIGVEAFSLHDFQRLAEHQDRQLLVPVGS